MSQLEEPKVLLVNDDRGSLFALQTILSDLDASVITATSGEEALKTLLKQDIAVIVLDVKMPGLDGFETAGIIRQRPRSRATPIIFLTAHRPTDLDRAQGYELGAVDYLFMPVAPEVLKTKVQMYLDLCGGQKNPLAQDNNLAILNQVLQQQLEQMARLNDTLQAELAALRNTDELAMKSEAERLIIQHAGDYVALLDGDARWIYASPSYADFRNHVLPGVDYCRIVHDDDWDQVRSAFDQLIAGGSNTRLQYRVVCPGKADRYFESEISLVPDASGKIAQMVLVSRDITERKEMEAYILHQSYHDALTGLPNRLLLEDRMRQATAHMGRQQAPVGVLFIDLDRFKDVNDTLGHAAGDRLLQVVAERLTQSVREGDTVARLSGDEFVMLLAGIQNAQDAALIAEKTLQNVGEPCLIAGRELHMSPSIGIAVFPDDGNDMDELLRNADTAMYHAKQAGRGRFSFFAPAMNDAASQRLAISSALQRAIQQDEFLLHYQPKIDALSGHLSGFEALIRWPRTDGEWIPPGLFIPIAEETGRIQPIGIWALQQAALQIKAWRDEGVGSFSVAVNLSAAQFRQKNIADTLETILRDTGIPPALLEVELTESAVMSDPAQAVKTLQKIRNLGVSISIDDFGTGYSSLAYLKRFPVDKLKIDGSFVRDIASDPDDAAIVTGIINLAHSLNLKVVAEGVETAAQLAFLLERGCDQVQGNYFSVPVPGDEALQLFKKETFLQEQLTSDDILKEEPICNPALTKGERRGAGIRSS